jgi:L-alanine-DL-glutamate epimerase-like enolase superfamily enzyme
MRIDNVELFYLSMPQIRDIGDGSQDALLVRVRSGELSGWGECEASPLVSIANFVCPMSHSACKNVHSSVIGRRIDSPSDIVELGHIVRANGLDIAQTDHTWSGVEIALWDLLGKQLEQPVYKLLGYERATPKTPYASQLFGDTPDETFEKAQRSRQQGFRAVKFGWAGYGRSTVEADRDHVTAARRGLGDEGILLIDAGTVWLDDVRQAEERLAALEEVKAVWLEEPFVGEAVHAYQELARRCRNIKLAGGEGASSFYLARHLIDHGGIGFVQIDTGRIGGIGPAKAVADYATAHGVVYVNHTFTTHLALCASLAPFAGIQSDSICEYPVEPSELAASLTTEKLMPVDGMVQLPDRPGLGVEPDLDVVRRFLVDVRIEVGGKVLYQTPTQLSG